MNDVSPTQANIPPILRVAAGEDREGEYRGLGISAITFKVASQDSGGLFVLENTFHKKGGPARHLHYDQDEWFYGVEGEFIIEVGQERLKLNPGDSVLAPRRVPHVWAYVGNARGRILIAFAPAGRMEAFFREVTKANAMAPQDPALWRAHGMELLGATAGGRVSGVSGPDKAKAPKLLSAAQHQNLDRRGVPAHNHRRTAKPGR